jgi:glutamate carboxypeptidase
MTPASLPFDADSMVRGLVPWVECESPTFDAAAVARMMNLAAAELADLGATIEIIPGRMGLGPSVRARLPHTKAGTPGILISGHMDTVHPIGTLALNPCRVDSGRLYGPGVLDMKAGNYLAIEAARQLLRAGIATPLPVTFLFTPDEEIGTPSTRTLIETEAKASRYVLVPEPARPDGCLTTGRYAIARFALHLTGARGHAGFAEKSNLSAVRVLARTILEVEAMSGPDCTFSINDIRSGPWVNCLPDWATAQVLSMARTQADLDSGVARVAGLAGDREGVRLDVRPGVVRPVWQDGMPGTMALFDRARQLAADLGETLGSGSMGGGSDANFTGALGIPSLCSLGASGDGYHTIEEYVAIDSLPQRGRLMAGLLATLAD